MFTINFFFFFGGGASPWECALESIGQSLARVKIWGAAPAKGQNVVSRKKVNYGLSPL